MSITSAIVLFTMIWTLIFFMVNPLWQTSQSEEGNVVPGTPAGAPTDAMVRRKALLTTAIAVPVFALVYFTVELRWLTLSDIDLFLLPSQR